MLGFITSLRHPQNSNDYTYVEHLLSNTLASWKAQTTNSWFGVVVGNQKPPFAFPEAVDFYRVDFPPPSPVLGPTTGREAVLLDKGSKLAFGLAQARKRHPSMTHFMFCDADDLISNRLAAHVSEHRGHAGWFIDQGWKYDARRGAIQPVTSGLHHLCGTTHIVRTDLYPQVQLDEQASRDAVVRAFGIETVRLQFGSHLHVGDFVTAKGETLAKLPFPAVVYRVGTGENHSAIEMSGRAHVISSRVSQEFGIPATGRSPYKIMRAVAPPEVLARHLRYRANGLANMLRLRGRTKRIK